MGIDGIGRGSRSQRTYSTHDTHGTHETHGTQRTVNPEPAVAQSNPAQAIRDGFDAAALDYGRMGGVSPEPAQAGADAVQQALTHILDGAELNEARALLQQSPTGAAALEYLDANQIPLSLTGGGASYYRHDQGIVIDAAHDAQQTALSLVHEIDHARADLEGNKPDVLNDTREAYVQGMLEEEARGTVASIQTKNELEAATGQPITATFAMEREYNDAYDAAVDAARQSDPSLTEAELRQRGQDAGYQAVLYGFTSGQVDASIGEIPYTEYYGSAWDEHN